MISPPIRGGTDGSRLTELGVPTPNIFTGMQNIHGPLEYNSLQDMEKATEVVVLLESTLGKRLGANALERSSAGFQGEESEAGMAQAAAPPENRGFVNKMLDTIEKVGNKVPTPVMMFLYLIIGVIVLSAVLDLANVHVTEDVIVAPTVEVDQYGIGNSTGPALQSVDYSTEEGYQLVDGTYEDDYTVETITVGIRSLLSVDGIRFIFTSFVSNFAGFSVVAVIFVSMIGIGVAEHAGLMDALIRKLVAVAPGSILTFVIILVGGLSSVATDAGYLILIPLAAAAFLSVGRHPLLGLAAAYAGVSAAFAVNILIAPLDALLTEMTNEAIAIADPAQSITITANWYFSVASTILMAVIMTVIAEKITAKQLGDYDRNQMAELDSDGDADPAIARKAAARSSGGVERHALGNLRAHWRNHRDRAPDRPERRTAARSRERRHHRQYPVHGQPDLHHHVALPGDGPWFRLRSRHVQIEQRSNRWRDQGVRRAVRPDLHAPDDQPVHRALQLVEHAER